jgi:hypothetical protein
MTQPKQRSSGSFPPSHIQGPNETKATDFLKVNFGGKGSEMQLLMQSDPSLSKY